MPANRLGMVRLRGTTSRTRRGRITRDRSAMLQPAGRPEPSRRREAVPEQDLARRRASRNATGQGVHLAVRGRRARPRRCVRCRRIHAVGWSPRLDGRRSYGTRCRTPTRIESSSSGAVSESTSLTHASRPSRFHRAGPRAACSFTCSPRIRRTSGRSSTGVQLDTSWTARWLSSSRRSGGSPVEVWSSCASEGIGRFDPGAAAFASLEAELKVVVERLDVSPGPAAASLGD